LKSVGQDLHQAVERAAAAADPFAAGVGDDEHFANVAEQPQLAADIQLRLVRLGLPLIRRRDNQVIPGFISHRLLTLQDDV
jgi:hypothetical protein